MIFFALYNMLLLDFYDRHLVDLGDVGVELGRVRTDVQQVAHGCDETLKRVIVGSNLARV
jgi:hypothetical protein